MRNFFPIMIFSWVMAGCAIIPEPIGRELSVSFTSFAAARVFVADLGYNNEHAPRWMPPQETIDRGAGACRDTAVLLALLAEKTGRTDVSVVVILPAWEPNPRKLHAIIKTGGIYIDPAHWEGQWPLSLFTTIREYTVDQALALCMPARGRSLDGPFFDCD